MGEEWVSKNLDNLNIDELEELDYGNRKIKYSVLGGFILGLFPQYTLMAHPYIQDYKINGLKARFFIMLIAPIPIISAYCFSSFFKSRQEVFVEQLRIKYELELTDSNNH